MDTRIAFWRATGDFKPGPQPVVCSAQDSPRWGPERSGDPRCVPGASVVRGARPEPPLRIGDL
jgi:hypothetical protein